MQKQSNRSPSRRSHWPVTALTLVSAAITIALPVVLVRVLSIEEVGKFKIFFLYLTLPPAVFLSSGIINGLALWAGHGDGGERKTQLSALLILVNGILAAGITYLFSGRLELLTGFTPVESKLFAMSIFGAIASTFLEEALVFSGRVWIGAGFQALSEATRACVLLAVAVFTRNLSAIFFAHAAFSLTKTILGYFIGMKFRLVGFRINKKDLAPILRYSLPVSAAALFGLALTAGDQFILTTSLPASEFALYAVGCMSLPPLLILEYSVARTLIPQLSKCFADGRNCEAKEIYRDALSQLSMPVIPAVIGLLVLSKPLIVTLFTVKFIAAAKFLAIFSLGYLLLIIPPDAIARARGESRWILSQSVVFGSVAIGAVYAGVYFYGAIGALIGSLTVKFMQRAYALRYAAKSSGWKIREIFPIDDFTSALLAALLAASITNGMLSGFSSPVLQLVGGGVVFWASYIVSVYFINRHQGVSRSGAPRVLMVTQHLGVGGLERAVLSLSRALAIENLAEVAVFAFDQNPKATYQSLVSEFRSSGIPVHTYHKEKGFSFGVVKKLSQLIHSERINILHSHDLGGLIYGAAAKILSLGKIRLIHTQHSFVHLRKARRYKLYERFFTIFADTLTVVSEGTKQVYRDLGLSGAKIKVVPNGIEFSKSPKPSGKTREEKRAELLKSRGIAVKTSAFKDLWLVYMARFHPVKGQDHALALWNELPEIIRESSYLFLIGPEAEPGEFARIDALISTAKSKNRIIRPGGTSDPQSWIDLADCYLSCSEFEGLPLAPIEAIGRGVPALLSEIEGHRFLSEVSEQYPLTSPSRGAEKLLRIVEGILSTDSKVKNLMAAKTLQASFGIERMAGSYAQIYRGA